MSVLEPKFPCRRHLIVSSLVVDFVSPLFVLTTIKLIVDLARRCEYAHSDSDDRYNMLNSLDIDVIWQWILHRYST